MDVEFVKSPRSVDATASEGGIGRLDRAAAAVARLRQDLATLQARVAAPALADRALDEMAALLWASRIARPGSAEFVAARARSALLQRFGTLDLPRTSAASRASVILLGGTAASAMAALKDLIALLAVDPVDLVLADIGTGPDVALLATLVRDLRVIGAPTDPRRAVTLAVSATHAPTVVLLDAAVARWPMPSGGEVWVGQVVQDCLARFGVRLGPPRHAAPGLCLALSRTMWEAAGGLDATMMDGQGLDMADICLKLRMLGAELVAVSGRSAAPVQVVGDTDVAAAAFRARWGDLRMQAAAGG